jgi:hypothetical protein
MTRLSWSSASGCHATLVALALVFVPVKLAAQEAPEESLVQRGLELRRRGNDAEALRAFEEAHAMRPSPRVRAQIALAKQALGAWVDAEAGLVDALGATADAWIARNRAPLEAALSSVRRHLAWLEVATNAPATRIFVNGVELRVVPGEAMRVVAGVVVLDVRAEGYVPVQRRLEIAAGARAREVVTLAPVAAPTPPTSPSTAPAVASSSAPPSTPMTHAPENGRRTFAWIAGGAGVTLLVTAVVAHVERENLAAIYLDDGRCFYGSQSREQRCGSYRQDAQTAQWIAIGSYALAGVALGASAYFFLSAAPSTPSRVGGVTRAVRCAPGILAFGCTGEF